LAAISHAVFREEVADLGEPAPAVDVDADVALVELDLLYAR